MKKTLLWITLFSVAMGYLESAVVVYLRALYYPAGFSFPLVPIGKGLAITEFFRELATILMLAGAGAMSGKNRVQSVAYFLYSFAVWDLFYYVFLKVLLNWPVSLLSWDILFLIPIPWVGPVLAPCIVCVSLIAFALLAIFLEEKGYPAKAAPRERAMLISGCAVIIFSFMIGYYTSVNGDHVWSLFSDKSLFAEAVNYRPKFFAWPIFFAGQFLVVLATVLYGRRVLRAGRNTVPIHQTITL